MLITAPLTQPTGRRIVHTVTSAVVAGVVAAAITSAFSGAELPWLLLLVAAIGVVALLVVRAAPTVVAAAAVLGAVATALRDPSVNGFIEAGLAGLVLALLLAGPLAVGAMIRQWQAYQQRGWELAEAEGRIRDRTIESTLQTERAAIAAEMHDGLGHQLTLIAVRLGRLSLDDTLRPDTLTELSAIRGAAAEAADQLGATVRLLRSPGTRPADLQYGALGDVVDAAQQAGVEVDATIPDDIEASLGRESAHAVHRVLQEGLANAARHAPGAPVSVEVAEAGADVTVTIRNPLTGGTGSDLADSAGHAHGGFGLIGLRHRAAVLGGRLDAGEVGGEFVVSLALSCRASPTEADAVPPEASVAAAATEAHRQRSRATLAAVAVPAVLVGAIVLLAMGYFAAVSVYSVLPDEQFAKIAVGDDRAATERLLPDWQMFDAPRDAFPAPPGSTCRYYESEVSFFDRVDVHVVCFDESQVTRTGTVPAP